MGPLDYNSVKNTDPKEKIILPATYTDKRVGFIAEEVQQIDPRLVAYNQNGSVQSVRYEELTAMLVQSVQELQMQNDLLNTKIAALESRTTIIEDKIKWWNLNITEKKIII